MSNTQKGKELTIKASDQLMEILNNTPVKYDEKTYEDIASSGYLPRLQLVTSNSTVAKEGKFPINHYAVVDNSVYHDVGSEVNVFVLSWRPKALDLSNDNIVVSYDPTSELYKTIKEGSREKDSQKMFGPEYLVYIPSSDKFATLFMGGVTTIKESPHLQANLKGKVTLSSKMIETKKYKYFSIKVETCTANIQFNPDPEKFQKVINEFNNPKDTELQVASTEAKSDRVR